MKVVARELDYELSICDGGKAIAVKGCIQLVFGIENRLHEMEFTYSKGNFGVLKWST